MLICENRHSRVPLVMVQSPGPLALVNTLNLAGFDEQLCPNRLLFYFNLASLFMDVFLYHSEVFFFFLFLTI